MWYFYKAGALSSTLQRGVGKEDKLSSNPMQMQRLRLENRAALMVVSHPFGELVVRSTAPS
jgi:hypothetical protein